MAGAAVESPSVRVLRDGIVLNNITIQAHRQDHISEAGLVPRHAAIRDFLDAIEVIELGVPFVVEVGITDWRRRISARNTLWNLVVDVKVLSATGLLFASASMFGEHRGSIRITFVVAISEMILISMLTTFVTGNLNRVVAGHFRPRTKEVNFWTDGCAMFVVLFTCLVDAFIRATLGKKLLLGVVMEQHVNVAFNLFGGRPINLAVLLQALLLLHFGFVLKPAVGLALIIVEIASVSIALIALALTLFELLLRCIALHVS